MVQREDVSSPGHLRQVLQTHGFTLKKALGQNFLIDERILNCIVGAGQITAEDGVFEIGPGAGVVTQRAAKLAKRVVAVEKDVTLKAVLDDTLSDCENVRLVFADVLKVDLQELWTEFADCRRVVVVANLPYYVTTPILFHILETDIPVSEIIVMVQKEVADRLSARPRTKDYGALTVTVAFRANVETVTQVHRGAFMPPPGVDSTVVRLHCYEKPPVDVVDDQVFRRVVKSAFATRRKTLLNALGYGLGLSREALQAILQSADIAPERRGETLTLEEFARLTNAVVAFT